MGLFLQAVEGDCDIHVLKQDGQFSVLFTKCDSSPGRVDYSYYGYPVERVRKGSELVSTEADLATLLVMKRGQGPWKPLRSGILKAGQLLSVVIPAKMMLLSFSKEIAPRSPTSASPSGQRQMVWAG